MKTVDVGRVSALYPEKGTARVVFDVSGSVSDELPILVRGAQDAKDYWIPAVGEQVVCLFLQEGRAKKGFIVGGFYNKVDKTPVKTASKRHMRFDDGSYVEYDSSTKTLTVDAKGRITIKTTSNVYVEGDVVADGISLKKHTHPYTNGSTGTPQ